MLPRRLKPLCQRIFRTPIQSSSKWRKTLLVTRPRANNSSILSAILQGARRNSAARFDSYETFVIYIPQVEYEGVVALRYAILVALSEEPKSGYDVAKQFDESIGFFWRARHSQIYRELGKLKESGMATSEEVPQSGKPNRIVFTITDAGRDALLQWSREPSDPPELKDHFLVQLYGIASVDLDGVRQNLLRRIERHQDRHAE